MKILVAEDDPVSAKVLRLTLERLGHESVVTCSGTEAWNSFDRDPPRLIVSDWMMPEVDGLELCRRVRARKNTAYTYFILLTALDTSAENYELATEAGVDDFLSKPLHHATIRMRLRVAERILRFTRELRELKALVPICCCCHKVRQDHDYWERVETYVGKHMGTQFTHGLCPTCFEKEMAKLETTTSDQIGDSGDGI
ncbi:MAG: response regulator [Verrucomicrobia bacterium]|nr:response regulator [Verrucomicrobiota bacterium]